MLKEGRGRHGKRSTDRVGLTLTTVSGREKINPQRAEAGRNTSQTTCPG